MELIDVFDVENRSVCHLVLIFVMDCKGEDEKFMEEQVGFKLKYHALATLCILDACCIPSPYLLQFYLNCLINISYILLKGS